MPRLKQITSDQAVSEAATLAVQMCHEYMADWLNETLLSGKDDDSTMEARGRYYGALGVTNLLMGADYEPSIPAIHVNGHTLVAINIVGVGLYRSYVGGTISHYVTRPNSKDVLPAADYVLKGDWIWLDPVRRQANAD